MSKSLLIDFSPFSECNIGDIVIGEIDGVLGRWGYSHNITKYGNTYQIFTLIEQIK